MLEFFHLTFQYNLFHATGLFLYPLKASENLWLLMFLGDKETTGMKRINDLNLLKPICCPKIWGR